MVKKEQSVEVKIQVCVRGRLHRPRTRSQGSGDAREGVRGKNRSGVFARQSRRVSTRHGERVVYHVRQRAGKIQQLPVGNKRRGGHVQGFIWRTTNALQGWQGSDQIIYG